MSLSVAVVILKWGVTGLEALGPGVGCLVVGSKENSNVGGAGEANPQNAVCSDSILTRVYR